VSAFRGKNATEGALAGFFDAIQTGRVAPGSTLLVESLDRLSRDQITSALTQFLNIINSGITVVTLMDKMTYNRETINRNPGSLMMSIVIMMRAHEESVTKSQRIGSAWAKKRQKARETGAPFSKNGPAWLRLTPSGYEIITERAAIVQRIFHLAAAGMGKRTITRTLNAEGVKTWGGKSWYDSGVWKLLFNPTVLGTFQPRCRNPETGKYIPDGEPVLNYFPAVITAAEWEAAKSRPIMPRGPRFQRTGNLFSGMVFCGYTGHKMRYTCRAKNSYLRSDIERFDSSVKPQTWPYEHLEKTVLQYLHRFDWHSLATKANDPEKDRLMAEAARLDRESTQKRAAIERILDHFAGDNHSLSLAKAAQRRAEKLAAELEALEAALQETQAEFAKVTSQTKAVREGVEEFRRLIAEGGSEERRKLQSEIRYRVDRITCFRHGLISKDGVILNDTPALKIEYHFGVSRTILISPDNPLRTKKAS